MPTRGSEHPRPGPRAPWRSWHGERHRRLDHPPRPLKTESNRTHDLHDRTHTRARVPWRPATAGRPARAAMDPHRVRDLRPDPDPLHRRGAIPLHSGPDPDPTSIGLAGLIGECRAVCVGICRRFGCGGAIGIGRGIRGAIRLSLMLPAGRFVRIPYGPYTGRSPYPECPTASPAPPRAKRRTAWPILPDLCSSLTTNPRFASSSRTS